MHNDKYLRVKQVVERTGLSRPTIYNMMAAGTFPTQTSLGERAVAWLESEVIKWMADRKTFDKSGREARPGRPPVKKIKAPSSPAKKNSPPTPAPSDVKAAVSRLAESDDWNDDQPQPTDEEMTAMRLKRMQLSKPRKSASTGAVFKKGPVVNLVPPRKK